MRGACGAGAGQLDGALAEVEAHDPSGRSHGVTQRRGDDSIAASDLEAGVACFGAGETGQAGGDLEMQAAGPLLLMVVEHVQEVGEGAMVADRLARAWPAHPQTPVILQER